MLELPDQTGMSDKISPYDLAKQTRVTPQYAYQSVRDLEKRGLVDGTRVTRHREFIEQWRRWHIAPGVREYLLADPMDFLKTYRGLGWGLTTYAGEMAKYHYLSPARWDLYIEASEFEDWDRTLREDQKALVGPGNVRLLVHDERIPMESQEVLVEEPSHRLRVVPDGLLVLDLILEGGPCVEAAERIMKMKGWT